MANEPHSDNVQAPILETPNLQTSYGATTNFGIFPPAGHEGRINDYEYYNKLFLGQHYDAFNMRIQDEQYNTAYSKLRYVTVNFAGLISRVVADMLFSEEPKIKMQDGDKDFMLKMWQDNQMNIQCYESALSNSALGDSVFRLRIGKRHPKDLKPTVIIEDITPFIYFPEYDAFNARQAPTKQTLAWRFNYGGKEYVREEIHEIGTITNKLYEMKGDEKVADVSLDLLSTIEGYEVKEQETTRINRSLIVHIRNWKTGNRHFGLSDYYDLDTLFYGINNRMSKIDNILDKHSDPILMVPKGIFKEDGTVNRKALGVVEIGEGEDKKPEYIVWDASLENAFKEIEKMVEFMYIQAEISPDILGLGDGVSDSGRALKFKLMRTIAKTSRKKLYYNHGLQELLYTAQLLAKAWGVGVGENYDTKLKGEPVRPDIIFQDGLPIDEREQVETEAMALDAGITTTKDAIRRVYGVDEEAAEKLADEAQEEKTINMPAMNLGDMNDPEDDDKMDKKDIKNNE